MNKHSAINSPRHFLPYVDDLKQRHYIFIKTIKSRSTKDTNILKIYFNVLKYIFLKRVRCVEFTFNPIYMIMV